MTRWFMLDTNTVSYVIRNKSVLARKKLAALSGNDTPCISAITEGEIRYGLAKATASPLLTAAVEAFLAKILILPWDSAAALSYGRLRAQQEKSGKPLGNLDMLIAAHAIAVGATLVTNDKAFSHVKDLPAPANWATDF